LGEWRENEEAQQVPQLWIENGHIHLPHGLMIGYLS
jgi:hypothetical protein